MHGCLHSRCVGRRCGLGLAAGTTARAARRRLAREFSNPSELQGPGLPKADENAQIARFLRARPRSTSNWPRSPDARQSGAGGTSPSRWQLESVDVRTLTAAVAVSLTAAAGCGTDPRCDTARIAALDAYTDATADARSAALDASTLFDEAQSAALDAAIAAVEAADNASWIAAALPDDYYSVGRFDDPYAAVTEASAARIAADAARSAADLTARSASAASAASAALDNYASRFAETDDAGAYLAADAARDDVRSASVQAADLISTYAEHFVAYADAAEPAAAAISSYFADGLSTPTRVAAAYAYFAAYTDAIEPAAAITRSTSTVASAINDYVDTLNAADTVDAVFHSELEECLVA